jgi:hypothetical protein
MKLPTSEGGDIVAKAEILDNLITEFIRGKVSIVLGSGASDYESFGVPKLKRDLLDILKLEKGGEDRFRINAISHVNKEPAECSFEELLSIYNIIYGKPINLFLKKQGIRPKSKIYKIPPLGHEIIAHFINHGLIDHVVSFNFDEYLEVSLDDEIGEDAYEWVRSKHIFQKLAEDLEFGTSKLPTNPLLIKPHGTISYPATIRPTFETVQQFEEEKEDLITRVLTASSAMLILGFSCPDPDFQKVLKNLILSNHKKIFWVDTKKDFQTKNEMFKFAKSILQNNCVFIRDNIDSFLVRLADRLHEKYTERYPAITRHKLRDYFGEWAALKSVKDWFRLETIIYAIKTRGMFSLEGLLTCKRIDNYCIKMAKKSTKIKDIFEGISNSGIIRKNYEIKSAEAYYIPIFNSDKTISKEILRTFSVQDQNGEKEKLLRKLIAELMRDFDFDFGRIDNYLYLKFYEPKIIESYEELYRFTQKIVGSAKEEISIITETGEWILREKFKPVFEGIKKKRIKIKLVIAEIGPKDDSHTKVQKKKLGQLKSFFPADSLTVKYLPWDEHNVHMTINEKGSGIYFHRKYKSPIFTPIYIGEKNEKDCRILKDEFSIFNNRARDKS